MLYAPLAVERLVAAVCVCRPYAAKPIGGSGCQGCGGRHDQSTTGATEERKEPGLDAGATEDYIAWPCKHGKPQRSAAGQGSGPRAAPTPEASQTLPRPWEAFHGSNVSSTQPSQQKTNRTTTRFGLAGVWGRLAPKLYTSQCQPRQARACLPCTRSACYRRPQTGRTAHPHGGAVTEQRTTKTLASPCVGASSAGV